MRSEQTYRDAEAVLHEAQQIQMHLAVQDVALQALADKLGVDPRDGTGEPGQTA